MFLKNYATQSRGNPSIDEQIKSIVVCTVFENNLWHRTGYFGESKTAVENELWLVVASFNFVQGHCNKLIRYQRTRFGSPILRGIQD